MPKNILIVDNHLHVCNSIKSQIHTLYPQTNIYFAHSGVEALQHCETCVPEIIFMDIEMPKLDGLETTKAIIKKYHSARIIIISSRKADYEIFNMAIHGARGFIEKGCDISTYWDAIESIAAGDVYFSEKLKAQILDLIKSAEHKKNQNSSLSNQNFSITSIAQNKKKPSDYGLTETDTKILKLLYDKRSNKEIKDIIFKEVTTIEYHIRQMKSKTKCRNRYDLRDFVIENGWHKNGTFDCYSVDSR